MSHDEFAENLKLLKDLQEKLDGLTVEMKIRGEMVVERDTQISDLVKTIHELEAQISIFKNQIAPALEQTITNLRSGKDLLESTVEKQEKELKTKSERIQASHSILERAGMGKLFQLEDFQININKKEKELLQKDEKIKILQSQVDQLPYICLQLINEIKKRESEIDSLKKYNRVLIKKLKLAQEKLLSGSDQTGDIRNLTRQIMELQDLLQEERTRRTLLDKEILMLNGLVMEKESKISKLEERVQKLIFSK